MTNEALNTKIVFTCFDSACPNGDIFLKQVESDLASHNLPSERVSLDVIFSMVHNGQLSADSAVICLAPVSLEVMTSLINSSQPPVSSDNSVYKGIILPYIKTEEFNKKQMRHLFGRATALGLHLAHPELDQDMTYCDPIKVSDLVLCKTRRLHTRYASKQVNDSIPKQVIDHYYGQFRAAIAEIFAGGFYNGLTDGSLSLKIDDGSMLCTTTKTPKEPNLFLPSNLALVHSYNTETRQVEWSGALPPTSSTPWHWNLLNSWIPKATTVLHTHTRLVTYSTSQEAEKVRSPKYARYGTSEVGDSVREILKSSPVAILRGHGEASVGEGFDVAVDALVNLKKIVLG